VRHGDHWRVADGLGEIIAWASTRTMRPAHPYDDVVNFTDGSAVQAELVHDPYDSADIMWAIYEPGIKGGSSARDAS